MRRSPLSSLLFCVVASTASACTVRSTGPDESTLDENPLSSEDALDSRIPRVDSSFHPRDRKVIALTFDDGPDDEGNTDSVLDTLRAEGVRATFFVNARNTVNVEASSVARRALQRIVAEGHELGNHTGRHVDLATLSATDVEREITDVENVVARVAPSAPRLTLLRAPYGSPYFTPGTALDRVGSIVGRHGVHVLWNIDTNDWRCTGSGPSCVTENTFAAVDDGEWGVMLLHSIHHTTAEALPTILRGLRARGFRFVTVEDIVREKYGKTSAELFGAPPPRVQRFCPASTRPDEALGFCVDDDSAYGPFTHRMQADCVRFGGGGACNATVAMTIEGIRVDVPRWSKSFTAGLRGRGTCPAGASFDGSLGYCVERTPNGSGGVLEEAYGPFEERLIAKCLRGGGGVPCYLNRWDARFLRSLL